MDILLAQGASQGNVEGNTSEITEWMTCGDSQRKREPGTEEWGGMICLDIARHVNALGQCSHEGGAAWG
jgi:hypothetical protein